MIKNPPANETMRVQSLGPEDPLEKEMATHSSILAWEIPWREEPGGLQSVVHKGVRHDRACTHYAHTHTYKCVLICATGGVGNAFPDSDTCWLCECITSPLMLCILTEGP